MFKRLAFLEQTRAEQISFKWLDQEHIAYEGDTVAAALIGAGIKITREHPVTSEPRSPHCMMGTCFECLVEIDGDPNKQACQVRLKAGMNIKPQMGARR